MRDRASELRAIADGRLMLNVRNGVTVSRSMLAMIADELDAERAAHAETKRVLDTARRALEPFAEAWDRVMEERPDAPDAVPFAVMVDEHDDAVIQLTWGHLRAASRVREGGEANG